ncbi:hypothetical protein ACWBC2_05330 [Salegentibacter agarivorans]
MAQFDRNRWRHHSEIASSININLKELFDNEKATFDTLVASRNYNGIIRRYPIRESQILNSIVRELGLSREDYEGMVRKLIINNIEVKNLMKNKLQKLTDFLEN